MQTIFLCQLQLRSPHPQFPGWLPWKLPQPNCWRDRDGLREHETWGASAVRGSKETDKPKVYMWWGIISARQNIFVLITYLFKNLLLHTKCACFFPLWAAQPFHLLHHITSAQSGMEALAMSWPDKTQSQILGLKMQRRKRLHVTSASHSALRSQAHPSTSRGRLNGFIMQLEGQHDTQWRLDERQLITPALAAY